MGEPTDMPITPEKSGHSSCSSSGDQSYSGLETANGVDYLVNGMQWEATQDWDSSSAKWTREPDLNIINTIAAEHLPTAPVPITAELFAEGSFNKVYKLRDANGRAEYIFRVPLPIDPFYKTASEIATIRFLQDSTSIPLPEIVAYDPFANNTLGFEWSIQRLLPGSKLNDIWDNLCFDEKMKLGQEVLHYMRQIQQHSFDQIGSLYLAADLHSCSAAEDTKIRRPAHLRPRLKVSAGSSQHCSQAAGDFELPPKSLDLPPSPLSSRSSEPSHQSTPATSFLQETADCALPPSPITSSRSFDFETANEKYVVGPIVNVWYSMRRGGELPDLYRGPFKNETSYLRGLTDFAATSLRACGLLDKSLDQEEIAKAIEACETLELLLDKEPFTSLDTSRGYFLDHWDLSRDSILIDPETCTITGIVDWEHISIIPRWELSVLPRFLRRSDVDQKPDLDQPPFDSWPAAERISLLSRYHDTLVRGKFTSSGLIKQNHATSAEGPEEQIQEEYVQLLYSVWDWPENVKERAQRFSSTGRFYA